MCETDEQGERQRRGRDVLSGFLHPEEMELVKQVRLRRDQELAVVVRDGVITEIKMSTIPFQRIRG